MISVISFNVYMNEFGLFGDAKGKALKIYGYEKTTKYLFSYNYIPANFDGILIGPSLSDQMMDTREFKKYKVYNLSMDGGNISELKYAVDNVLKYGHLKVMIICLDPYITINHGTKSSQINPREYYSTLGSLFILKYYVYKILGIRYKEFQDETIGFTHNEYPDKDKNSTKHIDELVKEFNTKDIKSDLYSLHVDKIAFQELSEIIKDARKKSVQIIAYYYPRPKRIFEHKNYYQDYLLYKEMIDNLLSINEDIVIDFNTPKYNYIRDNDSLYSDGLHLTKKGAIEVIKVLEKNHK